MQRQSSTIARPASYVLDADGWLIGQSSFVVELKAVKSGTATVQIFEKPHFLMPQELKKEIRINVAP